MRAARFLVLALLPVSVVLASRAAGAAPRPGEPLRAAAPGPVEDVPGGRGEMEALRFGAEATAALLSTDVDDGIRLADWPVAPGVRRPVVLTRFEVYAPDARIVRFVGGREVELPRSPLAFFKGTTADGGEPVRVVSWVDPKDGVRGGLAFSPEGIVELEPDPDPRRPGGLRVLRADAKFGADEASLPRWTCGQDEGEAALVSGPRHAGEEPVDEGLPHGLRALAPPTRTAVIAFDTDAEWVNAARHGGSVANAISYIATLVAGVNTIYERDAGSVVNQGVRVLQGYTIIRATEAEDPYVDTTGSADSTKLNEFTNYWEANYPRTVVKRALAAYLSGRQGSSSSASGIAWVSGLCNGVGYSIDQLFTISYQAGDLLILAHEIGHNFGARHTHNCIYGNPPIDRCLAAEGGCATQGSCPTAQTINGVTNVTGTLMSYCHLRGDGCTSSLVFHPSSVAGVPAGNSNGILDDISGASCLSTVSGGVVPTPPSGVAISPGSGPLGGGQAVTITGSGFAAGASVAFVELPSNNVFGGSPNTKALTGVTVVNATTITATTPSATNTGLVDVVVMNPDQQTATLRSGYTYSTAAPPPTVTAVSPNSGPTAGGTSVTITGTGFVATPSVTFGGTAATGETFVSATTITAVAPARAAGLVNVVVTNPDAQSGTLTSGYAYLPAPSATQYYAITPCRLFDTRNASGPSAAAPALAAGETRTFDVSGRCGVPETAVSLALNVTVTGPGAAGELRVFPGNGISPNPPASTLFYAAGKTRANNAVLRLATDGTLSYKVQNVSASSTHFILDVSGYFLP